MPTQHRATIAGRSLVYRDWGPPGGDPLVCVHGFTGRGDAYTVLAGALPHRRLLAPTLRGHGSSDWSAEQDYQVRDYVQDLEGLVRHWGLGTFDLLGTSLGGYVGIPFAAAHPDLVRRLILHDISPEEVPGAVQAQDAVWASLPQSYASPDEWVELWGPRLGRLSEDQLLVARSRLRQREDGRWVEPFDPALLRHRVERFEPPDYWEEFASLRCPVLIIWGCQSQWLSEANARRMVATGHDVELVEVPDEGHTPNLLGAKVFERLSAFLDR